MPKQSKQHIYIFMLVFSLFSGCLLNLRLNKTNYVKKFRPPNGVRVLDSLYCDQTEITNNDWLEYMNWTNLIYGSKSYEYRSVLPSHKVWSGFGIFPKSNARCNYYLEHPRYKFFPVVGITQKQAFNYTKWRSDRVFELMLVKLKIIERDKEPNSETFFTIEKYFQGKFNNMIPDTNIKYYLEYRLPNLEDRKLILRYADSVDKAYFESCHTDFCIYCKENFPMFHSDIIPRYDTLLLEPTMEVTRHFSGKSKKCIYNLRGNVAEWTGVLNLTAGGGWNDKRRAILSNEKVYNYRCDAWTGFRNICEWKKWKK